MDINSVCCLLWIRRLEKRNIKANAGSKLSTANVLMHPVFSVFNTVRKVEIFRLRGKAAPLYSSIDYRGTSSAYVAAISRLTAMPPVCMSGL